MEDPFYEVKADASNQMEQVRKLYNSFMAARNSGVLSPNTELTYAIEELSETLKDLKAAVEIAMKNSEHFGLDEEELKSRRRFVSELDIELNNIQLKMGAAPSTPVSTEPYTVDNGASAGLSEEDHAVNRQYQEQLYQQQDVMLDGVYDTIGNIRGQAALMGEELGQQADLLDTLDNSIETTNSKLRRGMKRLKDFTIASADSKSGCCITVLIIILIALLVLVIVL
ncbi:SNARE Tgl1 [Schizosaccharomyces pombe]